MKNIRAVFKRLFATRSKRWILLYTPFLIVLSFIIVCNVIIENNAQGRLYSDVNDVPSCSAAVVMGTSPGSKERVNLFYQYRMEAAAALWKAGKVKYIIVSGDNSSRYYDEATNMRKALQALGVPDSVITLDYAGFRTLDSVVRAYWVFGQQKIVVVSQEFQNERAIYIADHFGIDAVGFNAKDVPENRGWKTQFREFFARVAAVLDVTVLGTVPKFTGPPQPVGYSVPVTTTR